MPDESALPAPRPRRPAPAAPQPQAQLCVLLECDRPLAPSTRHSLAGVDEVVLRRGPHRSALRSGRQLLLSIADQWLSGTHARLLREAAGFGLRDAGSTNGTWVDGRLAPPEGLLLRDGELIELGHTLLLFRAAAPERPGTDAADLDGAQLDPGHTGLATLSSSQQAVHERVEAVARSHLPVVIGGEPGAGKEVVARALHALSGREGPFVVVDCGPLPLEAGLPALFRSARQGTLLFDEPGDLPGEAQAALQHLLQGGVALLAGPGEGVQVDVRVLVATRRDLSTMVRAGLFRADLLARLAGLTVLLPPLRERPEDLGLLVAALLKKVAGDAAAHVQLTCEAGRALARYRWPRNVRELEQCLRDALALAGTQPVGLLHLPEAVQAALHEGPPPVAEAVDRADPEEHRG